MQLLKNCNAEKQMLSFAFDGFIIKLSERRVPPLMWSQYDLFFSQMAFLINFVYAGPTCEICFPSHGLSWGVFCRKKGGYISLTRKPRSIGLPVITLTLCYRSCWRTVMTWCMSWQLHISAGWLMQQWLSEHCPDLTDKDSWPPNNPDLNPLDWITTCGQPCWRSSMIWNWKCET